MTTISPRQKSTRGAASSGKRSRPVAVILRGNVPEGAPLDEQDTLQQSEAISKALVTLGHEPVEVVFDLDVERVVRVLRELKPRVVFNLVETVEGKGQLIHLAPSILDYLGIPYTGGTTESIFLSSNKVAAKKLLKGARIDTAPWYTREDDLSRIPVGIPYIVKAIWEHASVGLDDDTAVRMVHAPEELAEGLEEAQRRMGVEVFAERYIDGREFNLTVLELENGPDVLPPSEMRFVNYPPGKWRILGYRSKWVEDAFEYENTERSFDFPPEEAGLVKRLEEMARSCWHLFGVKGYARVDFRVDADLKPWVLEVNVNPCLNPDGGFFSAVSRTGRSYADMIQLIVERANHLPAKP